MLREIVARAANAPRRRGRRPRFGIVQVGNDVAQLASTDEDAPLRDRAGT
jgi:hypothetical protein